MKWTTRDEMSLDKKKPPVMLYYASPEGYEYGFFVSTIKERRDEFLEKMNAYNRRLRG